MTSTKNKLAQTMLNIHVKCLFLSNYLHEKSEDQFSEITQVQGLMFLIRTEHKTLMVNALHELGGKTKLILTWNLL